MTPPEPGWNADKGRRRNAAMRHSILTTLAALLLALGLSGAANAGPYEDAVAVR